MRCDYAAHNLGGGAVVGGAGCIAQLALQPKLGILPQRRIGVGGADPGDLAVAGKNLMEPCGGHTSATNSKGIPLQMMSDVPLGGDPK